MRSVRADQDRSAGITATQSFYQRLYQSLYRDITRLESCCLGVPMGDVLEQLMVDDKQSPLSQIISSLSHQALQEGVLLHDMSGIGLYTVAYLIAKWWADKKVLTQFEAVIVVPLEWVHTANDITNIWGEAAAGLPKSNPDKTLIILSGCSAPSWRDNNKEKSSAAINHCLEAIAAYGYSTVVVSNASQVPYLKKQPNTVMKISLKPLNLSVKYECGEQRAAFVIPGKVVLETAAAAIQLNYLHRDIDDNHIAYTEDWAKQMFSSLLKTKQPVTRAIIQPEHTYSLLKPYKVVEVVRRHLNMHEQDNNTAQDEMVMFNSPANWYSAAVTATAKAADADIACYRISHYLLVRKLSNNYIACIDLADCTPTLPVELKQHYEDTELKQLKDCLDELSNHADRQQLSADELIKRLDRISGGKRKQIQGRFRASTENALRFIKEDIRSQNPEKKRFSPLFAPGVTDLAYHTIQAQANEALKGEKHPTQLIRQLLSGANIQLDKNIVLGLAATLLAETCRYRVNFMTTLCLLDLMEISPDEVSMWQTFFAHPQHVYHAEQQSIREYVLNDIIHTIGGLQAMSQGNSYNQVKPEASKPQHGMHWVDFKSHIILGRWVARLLVNEKELNPYFSASMSSSESQAPVVTDMLLGFRKIPFANPHIYDRFSRRLNSFSLMLVEQLPLRERLSGDVDSILSYLTEFKCQPFYRMMLTDAQDGLDYQKNRISYTMACRLFLGIALKEGDDGQKLGVVTMVDDHLHETGIPIKYYNAGLLNSVLIIDPLFYAVHYHAAVYYLLRLSDSEAALNAINHYLASAKMSDGDLYFCGIYIKLTCLFNLKRIDSFMSLADTYFKIYHDVDDEDYWCVHLMRASLSDNFHKQLDDLEVFFDNINFRSHPSYQSALHSWLTAFPELYQRHFHSKEDFIAHVDQTAQALEAQGRRLYLHRDGFFSPSRYASSRQPYGPFRDYLCTETSPSVVMTDDLTRRVK